MTSSGGCTSGDFSQSSQPTTRLNHSADGLTSLFSNSTTNVVHDGLARLKSLYPYVDVNDLPRAWSSKDKANFISLSENNLKVHYKGIGKAGIQESSRDAASVRATHPIPPACLLYYYEIKIISKGKAGYMGVGLAAADVNMQRLPGWDNKSYGYHGDDGHSFCSSGTGVEYGPKFTTGDVIGCGYNLVENICFYTKNGLNLGKAFENLAAVSLYPTVGLQTPGEEVEANFGMEPFMYDIEDDMKALRQRITTSILEFPIKYDKSQFMIHKLVQSWLIHNGYCSTAEVFSSATKQPFSENVNHIKQRLRIQRLVLNGQIGEAINLTNKLYPSVLRDNPSLLFALKCRQFIEMVQLAHSSAKRKSASSNGLTEVSKSSPRPSTPPPNGFTHNNSSHSVSASVISTSNNSKSSLPSSNDCNGNKARRIEIEDENEMETDDVEYEVSTNCNHPSDDDLIKFGRDLKKFYDQIKKPGVDEYYAKMWADTNALLAYENVEESPFAWLIAPSEREVVCQQLNNAIVNSEMGGGNQRPALEAIMSYNNYIVKLNGQCGAWIIDKL